MTELIKKIRIPYGDVKFRNKEFTITISTSLLDLDPPLILIVDNLANEGKLEVYLVSSLYLSEKFARQQ